MQFSYLISPESAKDEGAFKIITMNGDILETSLPSKAKQLLDEVEQLILDNMVFFIIDMSAVNHINSSGLNLLINILTKARNAGGDIIIAGIPEKVRTLFIISKLTDIFTVSENIESAVKKLKTGAGV